MEAHQWKERRIPVGHAAQSKSALAQDGSECSLAVAPKMVEGRVVLREQPLMGRHADDDTPPGS
jgi:hypothetical protein